ncbi:uncharacterized protein PV09_07352 [Verruconis gallopava]|uniref:DNA replication regulator Sld3 C-terminal domain-containing protein n=1 Tax=Verruconis gallopava TaxID=253628 RepID=A0A0D1XGI5_9PEZI|nr:uncharacterized protein PV09_07352 [Verruconis gallopava]KIW01316.1 hypothetical protein PV09_07352 [Verruconis gallopava]
MTNIAAEVQTPALSAPNHVHTASGSMRLQSPCSQKRKRDEGETDPVAVEDIHIRMYPGSIYDKPILLRPLRLVPRSRLPLSFLDTSAAGSLLSPSRLFTANIESLEHNNAGSSDGLLLIANLTKSTDLVAVERVKPRVYALCKLSAWVKIGYIEEGSGHALQHVEDSHGNKKWWSSAVIKMRSEGTPASNKRVKLSMAPPSKYAQEAPENITNPTPALVLSKDSSEAAFSQDAIIAPVMESPKPDEMFEGLIRQYLEALYISKTSLAFFVKGPLSRARNTVAANTNGTALITFTTHLRAMLLSMTQMDKKYREKLPEVIKSFPVQVLSDDELNGSMPAKKRRSKKSPKLSREGFYPIEEDFCRRWWLDNHSATSRARQDETFEQLVRRRVGDLRRRETLAQIVLILELLALEAQTEFKEAHTMTKESETGEATEKQDVDDGKSAGTKKTKAKGKKQQDLDLLLDLLLDKLSIWQSIEQDIGESIDKKQDSSAENTEKLYEQDLLAGFCTDVVIPFYKSRIPSQASLVNKKLGGPVTVSPAKPEELKAQKLGKTLVKPGEKRPRRPLQKTLSDVNALMRSRKPSLSRSLTDIQAIPRIKREASELSLLDVPLAQPSRRDSMSQLRHLQQRTVDLTAISTATEAKLKQKAKIEQELKDAINTLKKPNRGQAVRELVDAADQRSLGSASMRKRTMRPVRKVLQNVRNVQVTATPKHQRTIRTLGHDQLTQEDGLEEQNAPSSGDYVIPSSGYRAANADVVDATPVVSRSMPSNMGPTISATPSKKSAKAVAVDELEPDKLGPSPEMKQSRQLKSISTGRVPSNSSLQEVKYSQKSRMSAPSTPMKGKSAHTLAVPKSVQPSAIPSTPVKCKPTIPPRSPEVLDTTPKKNPSRDPYREEMKEQSIYDVLGWNDYDDD